MTAAMFCAMSMMTVQSVLAREIVLQDGKLLVAFNLEPGAITRLVDKMNSWTVESRPDPGLSFRMLVPLPDRGSLVVGTPENPDDRHAYDTGPVRGSKNGSMNGRCQRFASIGFEFLFKQKWRRK